MLMRTCKLNSERAPKWLNSSSFCSIDRKSSLYAHVFRSFKRWVCYTFPVVSEKNLWDWQIESNKKSFQKKREKEVVKKLYEKLYACKEKMVRKRTKHEWNPTHNFLLLSFHMACRLYIHIFSPSLHILTVGSGFFSLILSFLFICLNFIFIFICSFVLSVCHFLWSFNSLAFSLPLFLSLSFSPSRSYFEL